MTTNTRRSAAKLKQAVSAGRKPRNKAEASLVNAVLTEQQKLFVKYWAEGDSVDKAAKRAGYDGGGYGYQLKTRPNILAMYHELKEQYQKAAQVTREDVMNGFKDAIEMARLMSEPATMIVGWREIAKLCGFYEPKKLDLNITVNGSVTLERMSKMSDRELLDIIQRGHETGEDQTALLPDESEEAT